MKKTTILIPEELRYRADRKADQMGISFGQLAREAIDKYLQSNNDSDPSKDPFFADRDFYEGRAPRDASVTYEESLYEVEP